MNTAWTTWTREEVLAEMEYIRTERMGIILGTCRLVSWIGRANYIGTREMRVFVGRVKGLPDGWLEEIEAKGRKKGGEWPDEIRPVSSNQSEQSNQ